MYLLLDVYEPLYIMFFVDVDFSIVDPVIILTSLIHPVVISFGSDVFTVVVFVIDLVDSVVDVVVPVFIKKNSYFISFCFMFLIICLQS